MRALETGVDREVYGNVRNDGLIDGLPEDACVEVPCVADKNGVLPTRIGALPPQCLALNRTFVNVVELTVRAALEESRDLRVPGGAARPAHGRDAHDEQIVSMVRRPDRGPRRPDPRGHPEGLAATAPSARS